ncbi:MAG: pteridine reductase [Thiomargarita sp.]|nr:pteridine reductase [Thiomargarita sp.]
MNSNKQKVALITGGVKRIGAAIARQLHQHNIKLALQYRHSSDEAYALQTELNNQSPKSVLLLPADLNNVSKLTDLVDETTAHYGRLDILINNAAGFYPLPLGQVTEKQWDALFEINLKIPFFLSQAAVPYLEKTQGCIINLVDIHAKRPLKNHIVYNTTKAGLVMLTKSLAQELGEKGIRVNAVAPGAILWADNNADDKEYIITAIALKRRGEPQDIAKTVYFLINDANYITGQVIAVDGGRTLNQ